MPEKRRWGSGEVRLEKSGRWSVRWREHGRRRYRGRFGSEAEANRFLTIALALAEWPSREALIDVLRSWEAPEK
jgi:hypothetical protein